MSVSHRRTAEGVSGAIAIVGAACRYPDATSPQELWRNVLAQRQAFRRMPAERLPLEDYWSPDPSAPDRTYSQNAAVITNWAFDRAKYRVSRSTFESADLAHWLALEIADRALEDAGFAPPQERTGVIVGNTLTGDSSRAGSLRLRWPYVRRAAIAAGIDGEMLEKLEREFNAPFAPIGEDSLAGGLSNTIAGRICNYFGFNGGGYTVDGACSSSLLSIIHACNALLSGDLDVALAGGVDLSLDPFELVGFAKCTALAKERMWVYDRKSNGFLPGEGCGFVVLMRYEDAVAQERTIHARLRGWGMSSDGYGGMTRPEASGQRLALQRAYAKAGFPIDTVTLFEGHGTGTPIGDPIELETVTSLLGDGNDHPRFIGSIKANVGHTKAAAGIAGLLKSMMAVREGIVPPITGCTEPRVTGSLSVTQTPLRWPDGAPRRAAVSAMGFGGINTHVVVEAPQGDATPLAAVPPHEPRVAEIFLFGAQTAGELRTRLEAVAARAPELSLAELTDLAASLRTNITGRAHRAAFVASTPAELHEAAKRAAIGREELTLENDIAAAWLRGEDVDPAPLFAARFAKPFDLDVRPSFISSPTEHNRVHAPAGAMLETPRVTTTSQPAPPKPQAAPSGSTLRELVSKHTELSLDLVQPTSQLLTDLHLSSITVARLLADAARSMGVPPLEDPMSFANATIAEATAALEALRGTDTPSNETRFIDGVATWLRTFRIDDVPAPISAKMRRKTTPRWRILGEWPAAAQRFESVSGQGIVAVLPHDDPAACMEILLACRAVDHGERLVIVQTAPCGSGFARTLHLERPHVAVRIVNVDDLDASLENVVDEAEATGEFCEATYREGVRFEPRVRVVSVPQSSTPPLDASDTLLVTGGGKGIGFETALAFARATGAKLLLLGRTKDDDELRANFARLDAAGVRYDYVPVDVTKPLGRTFDGVTAILHAAGTNAPALLDAMDAEAFRKATAPKLDGLSNILNAIDSDALKLLVTFGSVIARTGMRGEAHYAFANEWLARRTEEFGRAHPRCRAICIEYSVWSGMGMGERLGTVDMLRRQGITPIAPDEATQLALQLAAAPPASHVMACGRLGDPPTLRFDAGETPLLRFLEHPRVHVPGVELVADAELSTRNDPYLDDHAFGGEPLFPAVVGMEAMVQIARAATGTLPSRIDALELLQPVTESTMRIASLVDGDSVRLALRTSSTQFRLDHFRARISVAPRAERPRIDIPAGEVDLDPSRDLYGPLLFHTGRFQRVRRYRVLTATRCVAELTPSAETPFHRYHPQDLLLGDLTIRDAAIHALQASVPQGTVLPAGIASVELFAPVEGEAIVVAREIERHADGFTWDLDIAAPDGLVFERWRGLRLQVVARRERVDDLAPALWGPFLERELGVRIAVAPDALDHLAGRVLRRKDGKPLVEGAHVSASHDGDIRLAVVHEKPVGCDVQVVGDDVPWAELLGHHDVPLADVCTRLSGDEKPYAAARVWSARESMKKLAGDPLVPLIVDTCGEHRRITFRSGDSRIDTFVLRDCVVAVARN